MIFVRHIVTPFQNEVFICKFQRRWDSTPNLLLDKPDVSTGLATLANCGRTQTHKQWNMLGLLQVPPNLVEFNPKYKISQLLYTATTLQLLGPAATWIGIRIALRITSKSRPEVDWMSGTPDLRRF